MKTYKTFKKRFLSSKWVSEDLEYIFNFDIPAKKFLAKHGEYSFKNLKKLKKKENFQKIDFLIDLLRQRLQFSILISLPKSFSPSTVNVRSKIWRVWKKNQNFQKLFFYSKCSFGHVEFSFNKQVEIFPPNFRKRFFVYCFTSHANISERIQIDT